MPSRFSASDTAVTSTIESPRRTHTAPWACFATLPVSRRISLPPTRAVFWMGFTSTFPRARRRAPFARQGPRAVCLREPGSASGPHSAAARLASGGPVGIGSDPRSVVLPGWRARFTASNRSAPPVPGSASAPAVGPRRLPSTRLLADAELIDERLVPRRVARPEVVEEPPPLADELQEPAPAVVVLLVRLEVLREVG